MRALKPFTSLVYSACVRQRASQQLASTAVYLSTASTGQHDSSSKWAWGAASAASAAILGLSTAVHADSVTVTTTNGEEVVVETPKGDSWSVNIKPATDPTPQPPQLEGPVQLLPPPYALNALEPFMSQETLEYHWGKHQRTYAENLNKQLGGAPRLAAALEKDGLEGLVEAAWNDGKPTPAFNNAAQVYNHQLFWASMKPGGGGAPSGPLADAIQRDFGGVDGLRAELTKAGTSQFGSGWAWLVTDVEGNLAVFRTGNAVTPLVSGWVPLLTIDVWEHAYYVDYRNRRADFIAAFLDSLVDWGAAASRYEAAVKPEGSD